MNNRQTNVIYLRRGFLLKVSVAQSDTTHALIPAPGLSVSLVCAAQQPCLRRLLGSRCCLGRTLTILIEGSAVCAAPFCWLYVVLLRLALCCFGFGFGFRVNGSFLVHALPSPGWCLKKLLSALLTLA
jgi:hypothetical protein